MANLRKRRRTIEDTDSIGEIKVDDTSSSESNEANDDSHSEQLSDALSSLK